MSNIGNKEIFAKNLAHYLEATGETQRELAEAVGVGTSTVNDWIKANKYPRIDTIEKLARHFGIAKSGLIEEKVTKEMKEKSDVAVNVTIRLGADLDFREVVKRNYNDDSFLALSLMLCRLDAHQMESVKNMLRAFFK